MQLVRITWNSGWLVFRILKRRKKTASSAMTAKHSNKPPLVTRKLMKSTIRSARATLWGHVTTANPSREARMPSLFAVDTTFSCLYVEMKYKGNKNVIWKKKKKKKKKKVAKKGSRCTPCRHFSFFEPNGTF